MKHFYLPLILAFCHLVNCDLFNYKINDNKNVSDGTVFSRKYVEKRNLVENQIDGVVTNIYKTGKSFKSLDDLLQIWNPMTVTNFWDLDEHSKIGLSLICAQDLTNYIHGAAEGVNWALKMIDASGKHTWGLFSGNRYWIGAIDQCREMESDISNFMGGNDSSNSNEAEVLPPFHVAVNSVKLRLEILKPGINGTHDITLGLCLPHSCTVQEVERLLYFVSNQTSNDLPRKLTVQQIRNLSVGYTFWEDKTFYVLMITMSFVSLFVVLGTLYDIALRYQVLKKEARNRMDANTMPEEKTLRSNEKGDDEITISKLWSVKTHNGALDVFNTKDVPKPLSEALLSFSLLLNVSKVCSLDVGGDTLSPIHGLRFLSMLWVILVHTCLLINEISDNRLFRLKAEDDFLYQTISNGTYAVDTFFLISGCLVSFLYFRTMVKEKMKELKITKGYTGQFMQFLGMMWYRYLRLTPPYLLVIGLIQVSMKWYHDHSVIQLPALDYKTCEQFWWRNALYVNTYFDMDERCMVWSWYLANDTQFYTVGIIILIVAAKFLSVGAAFGIILLVLSWITTATITLKTGHIPTIQDPFAHYESLYDKPWTRIGPYLVGMGTGWYLFKTNCTLKINKTIAILCWVLSILVMISIVYGLYGNMLGPYSSAVYTALSHSGWAMCVSWILIACVTGNGGLVNKILSCKYLYPLSRLTYCAYLIHPALMRAIILRSESSVHLNQGLVAIIFFGIVVASYGASFFLSLFFEAPMVSLLRIVHPLRQWKKD